MDLCGVRGKAAWLSRGDVGQPRATWIGEHWSFEQANRAIYLSRDCSLRAGKVVRMDMDMTSSRYTDLSPKQEKMLELKAVNGAGMRS
jgi:urease beta subunit